MISALGPYRDFKTRWIGDNDLVRRAGEMKVNIFIAHSRADTVVDSRQSVEFYDGLSKSGQCPKKQLRLIDGGGHNYDYWDSEIVPMLDFFESTLEKASR
jgi:S-formylglutathione hydrolase FrmB